MFRAVRDFSFRHPQWTLCLWLVTSLLLGLAGLFVGAVTEIPGPTSRANLQKNPGEILASQSGIPGEDLFLAILTHQKLLATDPLVAEVRKDLFLTLRTVRHPESGELLFKRLQTYGEALLEDEKFLSADKHSSLILANSRVSVSESANALREIPDVLLEWSKRHPGFELNYFSGGIVNNEMFELIHRDLDHSLIYTLPLTLLILLWAFGSLVAALLPLFMALISLFCSLGVSAVLSHFLGAISATSSQLVVLLVLALGVDYSLFLIKRVREQTRAGVERREAIIHARRTTGDAVFWSGVTVTLSLLGLLLMRDTILTSMAVVAIVAVLVTLFGCLVVLPSLLLLIGSRLEYGTWRRNSSGAPSPFLQKILISSVRRPVLAIFCGVLLIGGISWFSQALTLGTTIEPRFLPSGMKAVQAFAHLEEKFPDFAGVDFSLIVASEKLDDLDETGALQDFFDKLREHVNVRGPLQRDRSEDRQVARFHFLVSGSGNDPANQQLVHDIRSKYIPTLIRPHGAEAFLAGTLPFVVDERDLYARRTPAVFGLVLCLSMLFLLVAFRSVVVPLKAILLNISSTAASFGVLVLVFQLGPFEAWHSPVIEAFVPALLFSILFGLSMDYHVFLLSRVQEEVTAGADTATAVETAVLATSSAINSAAMIMVSVFAVVATLELPVMKQLGVGLAVAVFLDATVIRTVLLPSSMVLLGKWNWYLPTWLRWIPKVSHGVSDSASKGP